MEFNISLVVIFIKILLPILCSIILLNAFKGMKSFQRGKKPLIVLHNTVTNEQIPVFYWENSIGRKRSSDIRINDPMVSREHAVLFRRKDGWIICDTRSKGGVALNGKQINGNTNVYLDDVITLGGTNLILKKYTQVESVPYKRENDRRNKSGIAPTLLLFLTTIFHFLLAVEYPFTTGDFTLERMMPFFTITIISWLFFFISTVIFKRLRFELETLGLLLSGIGLIIIGNFKMSEVYTQALSLIVAITIYCFLIVFIENIELACRSRYAIAIVAVALFAINIIFAKEVRGSKNWINVGPFSLQISEFIKIAYVFVGASTLEQLKTTRNLTGFVVFSSFCIGSLFMIKDFGTACIFFVAFLIISLMRSGSFRTLVLSVASTAIGTFIVFTFKPYIKDRFAVWGHVFENVDTTGFQQSRTLVYSASGGLFGLGGGQGRLKNIFAGPSDLMFGVVCEELGYLIAILIALTIALVAFSARKQSIKSRSTFYVISACAAASMLVTNAMLHIFGITDIFPLTGVTLPFVSLGGSNLVSCWGMLAFIKAADERTYAIKRS